MSVAGEFAQAELAVGDIALLQDMAAGKHAAVISVTQCPAARSSSTRARRWPVALRGPLGPGLVSANRLSLPREGRREHAHLPA